MIARLERVRAAIYNEPWAILPEKLDAICEMVEAHVRGERAPEVFQAAARPERRLAPGAIGVLPVFGVISARANLMSDMSGGTSTEQLRREFDALLADPEVGSILLDVNSPGGSVYGVAELAQHIFSSRGAKPIAAIANFQAASGAYWIASAADELAVSPSGEAGSIGVIATLYDLSKQAEMLGVQPRVIRQPPTKAEGQPGEVITDEALAYFQGRVDQYYKLFVDAVSRHRGVTAAEVKDGFGQGRMLGARDAVKAGLADRVATMEEMLARLGARKGAANQRARALAVERERIAIG